jgi:hypothetical protein
VVDRRDLDLLSIRNDRACSGEMEPVCARSVSSVIPAKAGTQCSAALPGVTRSPAFARVKKTHLILQDEGCDFFTRAFAGDDTVFDSERNPAGLISFERK